MKSLSLLSYSVAKDLSHSLSEIQNKTKIPIVATSSQHSIGDHSQEN